MQMFNTSFLWDAWCLARNLVECGESFMKGLLFIKSLASEYSVRGMSISLTHENKSTHSVSPHNKFLLLAIKKRKADPRGFANTNRILESRRYSRLYADV